MKPQEKVPDCESTGAMALETSQEIHRVSSLKVSRQRGRAGIYLGWGRDSAARVWAGGCSWCLLRLVCPHFCKAGSIQGLNRCGEVVGEKRVSE